jgi:hypothetical protein
LRYRGYSIIHRSACALPLTRIQRHGASSRDLFMTRTHGLGGPCYGVLAFQIRCSSVEFPATPENCSMPGTPRSPLARPASSALARPLTWGYRKNSGGRQKLSSTGVPTRSEGFFQCRAIVPNGSTRRAAEASYGCSAVCLTSRAIFKLRSIGDNRSTKKTSSVEPLSPMALHDAPAEASYGCSVLAQRATLLCRCA